MTVDINMSSEEQNCLRKYGGGLLRRWAWRWRHGDCWDPAGREENLFELAPGCQVGDYPQLLELEVQTKVQEMWRCWKSGRKC